MSQWLVREHKMEMKSWGQSWWMSPAEQTCPGQAPPSSDPFFGQHHCQVCCQKGAGEGVCAHLLRCSGAARKGECGPWGQPWGQCHELLFAAKSQLQLWLQLSFSQLLNGHQVPHKISRIPHSKQRVWLTKWFKKPFFQKCLCNMTWLIYLIMAQSQEHNEIVSRRNYSSAFSLLLSADLLEMPFIQIMSR